MANNIKTLNIDGKLLKAFIYQGVSEKTNEPYYKLVVNLGNTKIADRWLTPIEFVGITNLTK